MYENYKDDFEEDSVCPNCGRHFESGDVFCLKCGMPRNHQSNTNNFLPILIIIIVIALAIGVWFLLFFEPEEKINDSDALERALEQLEQIESANENSD
ncbi:MAG: hypothetical protein LUE12_02785 [Ruminococcus sp.]|nr:hypothetical protein [Ruminococcus sp.]